MRGEKKAKQPEGVFPDNGLAGEKGAYFIKNFYAYSD